MRHLKPEKVFISAYRKENTPEENQRAHDELACELALIEGVQFRELEGFYDGCHEECYVVFLNRVAFHNANEGADIEERFRDLGAEFNQDTILWVHPDDGAELLECRPPRGTIPLGTFQRVGAPKPHEDYTLDTLDGSHFVVR